MPDETVSNTLATHPPKGDSLMTLLRIILVVLAAGLAMPAIAQDKGTTNMEILRQKMKADKKLVVAANMGLTEAEGTAFWPIYDACQTDLEQINERLRKTIGAYADAYNLGTAPSETAKTLLDDALANVSRSLPASTMGRRGWASGMLVSVP
jgi:hypothetical protein